MNVEYTLAWEKSRLRVLCTFTQGKLQFLHMLDCVGEPLMDKEAYAGADVVGKARAFLDNYEVYTSEALYGELSAMLHGVALRCGLCILTAHGTGTLGRVVAWKFMETVMCA